MKTNIWIGALALCALSACKGSKSSSFEPPLDGGPEDADGRAAAGAGSEDAGFGGSGASFGAGGSQGPGAGGSLIGAGGALARTCGNGVREDSEACDGDDLGGLACTDLGFDEGVLKCSADCRLDTFGCADDYCLEIPPGVAPECGGELCNCFPNPDVNCDSECWDEVQCHHEHCGGLPPFECSECPPPSQSALQVLSCMQMHGCGQCGDGTRQPWELCDGDDLGGYTCADLGRSSGQLRCQDCALDSSGCSAIQCGDGVIGPGEGCEGSNLQGKECASFGYVSGDLSCVRASCRLDFSGCEACGNGFVDPGEACDGDSFDGNSCRRRGFAGGSLACTAGCELDDAGCTRCGNGSIEAGENCDGAELGGTTCESLGYSPGTLGCSPTACTFDVSGCPGATPSCSDGIVQAGEQCDGAELLGLDCSAFGFGDGELRCSANCRFDTSACQPAEADPCERCRELRCGDAIEACAAEPGCAEALNCAARCSGEQTPFCFEECAWVPSFNAVERIVTMAGAVLTCVSLTCSDVCGGPL